MIARVNCGWEIMQLKGKVALLHRYYDVTIAFLAVISIVMVIIDYSGVISLNTWPYWLIDNIILMIFAIDYFVRLAHAKSKWQFFRTHLLDLLAIIPFSSFFAFFRFSRAFRLLRFSRALRLTRLAGIITILQHQAQRFLH